MMDYYNKMNKEQLITELNQITDKFKELQVFEAPALDLDKHDIFSFDGDLFRVIRTRKWPAKAVIAKCDKTGELIKFTRKDNPVVREIYVLHWC